VAAQLIIGVVIGVAMSTLLGLLRNRVSNRVISREPGGVRESAVVPDGSSDFLSDVLDALTIGVVVASPDGDIVYRNAQATGLARAAHAEVLVDEAVDNYVRAAVGGRGGRKVLDLFGPPRQVISVTALPLLNGGAVAMVEDTTERALVDAVRTDFVANISHELKTPIGAMSVLAETLTQTDDAEVVARLSGKISDESMRVGRLIDDLLELSRLEYGGQTLEAKMSVSDIISEAVDRTQTLADGREIRFITPESDLGEMVIGDRRQLVSALQNLLENAIKYSDPGTSVEVSVRRADGEVMIEVRDRGVGIPAKEIDRIFERFYRVDRARSRETGGTGLGLSIARHIAHNHGGDILVHSVEGAGSTFTLKLPSHRELSQ
jgi:two-component system sensor histidine kinase SenX3